MPLNITGKFVSVFQVEEKPERAKNTVFANLSTSEKKEDGTYENMYWKAKFVGKAYEAAKKLKDADKVNILSGLIKNNFDKENEKLWVDVVIFEFEMSEKAGA